MAEAFRRQGHKVEFFLKRGADGGVDSILRGDGRISLVQCKQGKVFPVGAPAIREMSGRLTAERGDEAIIVTPGKCARDAEEFAAGRPMGVIDGTQVLAPVLSVQTIPTAAAEPDR